MGIISRILRRRRKTWSTAESSTTSEPDTATTRTETTAPTTPTTPATSTTTTTATRESRDGTATPDTAASVCGQSADLVTLPGQYQRKWTKRGCVYYVNHVDKTTSWLHPVKLGELREAGVVAPDAASGPEREVFELMTSGGIEAGGPLLSRDQDDWYAHGTLPPWILREPRGGVGGGGGGGAPSGGVDGSFYWVDYRANKVLNRDPIEVYRDERKLEQDRRQELEADIRRLGMGNPKLAAGLRKQGWTGHTQVASDREIAHWL
ncbi:hypothetical protein PpBr36_07029 [Pyricularia pennisetigena]|uniref:hypothetical protein n=1 Tax=Pyricularia pennisetigena TaxID=1578925 RepID=UPI00114D7575|nr:hypothetical protein PpBr36_07029 [Pyricularia pennisetigena]TLS25777.1 hypothetical protein PpBr36_07029 [Pyricularia pennisetigena]